MTKGANLLQKFLNFRPSKVDKKNELCRNNGHQKMTEDRISAILYKQKTDW